MKFKVEIEFKKGPAFSAEIGANNKEEAKIYGVREAKRNGFTHQVKKALARPA